MTQQKPRYDILDGLRGVAALAVLLYHVTEDVSFATGGEGGGLLFHGFLAVDFFFILSGFVMGYAYDLRWKETPLGMPKGDGSLSMRGFVARRLIRLHPMVVAGTLLAALVFVLQGHRMWDGNVVALPQVLVSLMLSLLLIPSPYAADVRGYHEMFPLNGPLWSLFFEYLGSFAYGLFLRRMPTRLLTLWVAASAIGIAVFSIMLGDGNIAFGWSTEPIQLLGGALRISFGYSAGLLLARLFRLSRPKQLKGPVFAICGLAIILLLATPLVGKADAPYQWLCLFLLFPIILWVGACGKVQGRTKRICDYVGRLSYPLYATHYAFISMYIWWIKDGTHPFGDNPLAERTFVVCLSLLTAALFLRFYDEPLRRRLGASSAK